MKSSQSESQDESLSESQSESQSESHTHSATDILELLIPHCDNDSTLKQVCA